MERKNKGKAFPKFTLSAGKEEILVMSQICGSANTIV